MKHKELTFSIVSKKSNKEYRIKCVSNYSILQPSFLKFECSCPAGLDNKLCYHLTSIINNDYSLLENQEEEDIIKSYFLSRKRIFYRYQRELSKLFNKIERLDALISIKENEIELLNKKKDLDSLELTAKKENQIKILKKKIVELKKVFYDQISIQKYVERLGK